MVCVILNVGVWPAALVPFKCLPSLALWKQLPAKVTAAIHRPISWCLASGWSEFV